MSWNCAAQGKGWSGKGRKGNTWGAAGGQGGRGGKGGKGASGGRSWWATRNNEEAPQNGTGEQYTYGEQNPLKRSAGSLEERTPEVVALEIKKMKAKKDLLRWELRTLQVCIPALALHVYLWISQWIGGTIFLVWNWVGTLVFPLASPQLVEKTGGSQKVDSTRCKFIDPTPVQQNKGAPEPCPPRKKF